MPITDRVNPFSQRLIDLVPEIRIQFSKLDLLFGIAPFLQQLIGLSPKTRIRIF